LSLVAAGPLSEADVLPGGVLVLDNCDDKYDGKASYEDNLTLFGSYGKQKFRITGFNNCQSIGSNRMIAADSKRKCVWVIENVAQRIRRFDLSGKETLEIPGVKGSAIAVDPETGHVWTTVDKNGIGDGAVTVYDPQGKVVAKYDVAGWDIVYDPKAKAFWVAAKDLTKISAKTGAVSLTLPVALWCASSVDVDPRSGAVWVGVRDHSDVLGSSNMLLKFDADGKELEVIPLGEKDPFRVSIDPTDGSLWVANLRKSVDHYSADGKLMSQHEVHALAVQVDPAGGAVWVATQTETIKLTPKGVVKKRVEHAGKSSQAWMAAFE
jgi:DNA-binding beta-propeller fold protein YncE